MYSMGGILEKGPKNRYRVEMHVHSPISGGELIEKIYKYAWKRVKKEKKCCLKQISKFSRAFQKYSF